MIGRILRAVGHAALGVVCVVAAAWVVGVCGAASAAPGFRVEHMDDRIQNTACEVGPDGHLYVVSMNYHDRTDSARLTRYLLDTEGRPTGGIEVVHEWGGDSAAQPIGLAFDPDATPENLVAWLALGESLQGHSGWSDPWAGRIYRARLPARGSSAPARFELKITNLPHAFHTVNDLSFGPDGRLYICVGSTTTLGWELHMTEQLLSGAILQADVHRIDGVLDVKTADGGGYNPFAPDAPVRLHGTAIRQAYDCVWHPNGRLYACSNQNDVNGQTGAGGGIPDVRNARPPEYLAIIERGRTYGFPNASRGEFVLMGGNPTDGDDGWTEIAEYPVGVEPPATFDASLLHRIDDIGGGSANGIIAYRAGGALHGRLITCFYSAHRIYTFMVGDDGRVIDREPLRDDKGELLRIDHPLDLCEHPTRGHLYVAAYGKQDKGEGGAVYFLERTEPLPSSPPPSIEPIVVSDEVSSRAEREYFAVSAGNSRDVTAREFPVKVSLNGTVMSAAGNDAVRTAWELESGGDGDIRFSDPDLPTSTAILERPGRYVLRLVARRGAETRVARTTVLIDVPGNQPPTLEIAVDEELVRVGDTVRLTAKARDDGLPAEIGGLSYRWSREGTGVGIVTFSASDEASTAARFSEAGDYRLRCVVSDGVREVHEDIVVRVRER